MVRRCNDGWTAHELPAIIAAVLGVVVALSVLMVVGGYLVMYALSQLHVAHDPHFAVPAAARMGDQRAISDRTKRSKAAGLRSSFAGIEPPSWAIRSRTTSSSSARSSASESLAMISGETPFGANSPAQTLIS